MLGTGFNGTWTTANTKMLVYSNCLKHKLASYSCLVLSLGMQIYTIHLMTCMHTDGVMLGLPGATI